MAKIYSSIPQILGEHPTWARCCGGYVAVNTSQRLTYQGAESVGWHLKPWTWVRSLKEK